jgi:hypothetical protein
MPDYSKGKIYKIVCNTTGLVYIGSTCEPTLARRLAGHRGSYNDYIKGKVKYTMSSFKVLENSNYEIILIEIVNCLSKDELHSKERFYIESIECVNKNIPSRTQQEYYEDNKESIIKHVADYYKEHQTEKLNYAKEYATLNKPKILEYKKEYRINNKEKISEYKKLFQINNKDKIKEAKAQAYLKKKLLKLSCI